MIKGHLNQVMSDRLRGENTSGTNGGELILSLL